jgi:hypothetical protein
MLILAEELYLLALHEQKGDIPSSIAVSLQYALGAALLADLVLAGNVCIQSNQQVLVQNESICEDKLLDETLDLIRHSNRPHKVKYWLTMFSEHPKKLQKRLAARLVTCDILRCEEKKYFWVIPYTAYPQQEQITKYQIKQRLRAFILGGEKADKRLLAFASLVRIAGLLDYIFTKDEVKSASRRLELILSSRRVDNIFPQAFEDIENAASAAILADAHS